MAGLNLGYIAGLSASPASVEAAMSTASLWAEVGEGKFHVLHMIRKSVLNNASEVFLYVAFIFWQNFSSDGGISDNLTQFTKCKHKGSPKGLLSERSFAYGVS